MKTNIIITANGLPYFNYGVSWELTPEQVEREIKRAIIRKDEVIYHARIKVGENEIFKEV